MIEKIKKYNVFLKYLFSAGLSFILDQLLFFVFNSILKTKIGSLAIIISSVLARTISSLFNYFVNKRIVFDNKGINTLVKYFSLVVIQLVFSTVTVFVVHTITNIRSEYIKFFIDIIIFIINYLVQKYIIFVKKES